MSTEIDTQAVANRREDERPVIVQRPPVTTREDESGIHLQVALPGVRKENLRLTVQDGNLNLQADRSEHVPDGWKTHRDNGRVRYELNARLTQRLDGHKITASLEDGILSLHVPLREEARPREISIG